MGYTIAAENTAKVIADEKVKKEDNSKKKEQASKDREEYKK
jgi:hypothetical protein